MRHVLTAILGLSLLACARQPAGPTVDFDSGLDAAEARAFCERWLALAAKETPAAALERARLVLAAPPAQVLDKSPCGTVRDLLIKGAEDARRAARELGGDPEAWRVLGAYRLELAHDIKGAAEAACRAAELGAQDALYREGCGDALRLLGDGAGAVREWKAAILASIDREQQFDLIEKIQATSQQPATDIASLPPEVVDQYRQQRKHAKPRGFHGFP